jgi:hypothetical protein
MDPTQSRLTSADRTGNRPRLIHNYFYELCKRK